MGDFPSDDALIHSSAGRKRARELYEALRTEVERLREALDLIEQGTGELCPACGWRGIRGDDGCAFCAFDAKGIPAGDEVLRLRQACLREQENTQNTERERDELNTQWTTTGKHLLERAEKAERERDGYATVTLQAIGRWERMCAEVERERDEVRVELHKARDQNSDLNEIQLKLFDERDRIEKERDEARRERDQAIADKERILSLENMR